MLSKLAIAGAALVLVSAAPPAPASKDPKNPTCPKIEQLNFSHNPAMIFTLKKQGEDRILLAEGGIDPKAADNLKDALDRYKPVSEIWLRSPGGNAEVGNAAGKIIRKAGIPTRIPSGWACFSACNFLFMGGPIRFVDKNGMFIVHMFTHLADREAIRAELKGDDAIALVGDIEQGSALLATDDNDFLIRMGVSRKLLTEVMYRQKAIGDTRNPSTRRCLTQDELREYNVKNAE